MKEMDDMSETDEMDGIKRLSDIPAWHERREEKNPTIIERPVKETLALLKLQYHVVNVIIADVIGHDNSLKESPNESTKHSRRESLTPNQITEE